MIDPMPDAPSSDQVTTHSRVDGEPVRWGTGWISGVVGITLGIFGFGAVVCMRFPDWLTMPALRELYPLPVLRVLLQAVLVVGFGLGVISLSLRKKPILGGIACARDDGGFVGWSSSAHWAEHDTGRAIFRSGLVSFKSLRLDHHLYPA